MRSYLIDEISPSDIKRVHEYLQENAIQSGFEKVFWVKIPEDLLTDTQYRHRDCRPYAFATELGTDWIKLEFLVRNLNNLTCGCGGYATPQQRDFIFNYAHHMIGSLGILT